MTAPSPAALAMAREMLEKANVFSNLPNGTIIPVEDYGKVQEQVAAQKWLSENSNRLVCEAIAALSKIEALVSAAFEQGVRAAFDHWGLSKEGDEWSEHETTVQEVLTARNALALVEGGGA